jgi:hypothetical protein
MQPQSKEPRAWTPSGTQVWSSGGIGAPYCGLRVGLLPSVGAWGSDKLL